MQWLDRTGTWPEFVRDIGYGTQIDARTGMRSPIPVQTQAEQEGQRTHRLLRTGVRVAAGFKKVAICESQLQLSGWDCRADCDLSPAHTRKAPPKSQPWHWEERGTTNRVYQSGTGRTLPDLRIRCL